MSEQDNSQAMPNWDLTDLYPSPDSQEFKNDLAKAATLSERFAKRYQGNLKNLSGEDFAKSVEEYEKISGLLGKMGAYAYLLRSTSLNDEKIMGFYQGFEEKSTDIGSKTLFYSLEINRLSDENLAEKMANPNVAHYKPWLDNVRSFRKHDLSDDLEKMSQQKAMTGHSAIIRLYDETLSDLRYNIDGKQYTETEVSALFENPDREMREKAAKARSKVLNEKAKFFAFVTNTLALDKKVDDEWRGFKEPYESRNLGNNVENEVVDALVSSVKNNYANTSHRYYALKAKWLGLEKLESWDKHAPIPDIPETKYSFDDAKRIVLKAFGEFSPEMAEIGKKFFDNNWIDVAPKEGKRSGAYSMPGVQESHPYILLNFQGRAGDVMTLAHELGHGVHQYLAKERGDLMADTPLTLAETASVFGEMLTFKSMLKEEKDPKKRFSMLAEKTSDMLGTAVTQIAFHSYETDVHKERRENGELSVERLNAIWSKHQKDSSGPSVNQTEVSETGWGRIPHMIHTPFYVYAYAFGDCLVNSLYKTYEDGKVSDFQGKYLEMLSKGGTEKHKEMLAPFGLDASKPDFWDKGLKVISGFVDELEKLTDELGMDKTKTQQPAKAPAKVEKNVAAKALNNKQR
ncbi:MAG: M3 family oligoendopeptidase [Alphaproteobacteria bacterium]